MYVVINTGILIPCPGFIKTLYPPWIRYKHRNTRHSSHFLFWIHYMWVTVHFNIKIGFNMQWKCTGPNVMNKRVGELFHLSVSWNSNCLAGLNFGHQINFHIGFFSEKFSITSDCFSKNITAPICEILKYVIYIHLTMDISGTVSLLFTKLLAVLLHVVAPKWFLYEKNPWKCLH